MFSKPVATIADLTNAYLAFVLDRYSSAIFQGIIPNSGVVGVSTVGEPQFLALKKLILSL